MKKTLSAAQTAPKRRKMVGNVGNPGFGASIRAACERFELEDEKSRRRRRIERKTERLTGDGE